MITVSVPIRTNKSGDISDAGNYSCGSSVSLAKIFLRIMWATYYQHWHLLYFKLGKWLCP